MLVIIVMEYHHQNHLVGHPGVRVVVLEPYRSDDFWHVAASFSTVIDIVVIFVVCATTNT